MHALHPTTSPTLSVALEGSETPPGDGDVRWSHEVRATRKAHAEVHDARRSATGYCEPQYTQTLRRQQEIRPSLPGWQSP